MVGIKERCRERERECVCDLKNPPGKIVDKDDSRCVKTCKYEVRSAKEHAQGIYKKTLRIRVRGTRETKVWLNNRLTDGS
jgi:hypothetical protein